jgi:hypothetical protein
MKMAEEQTQQTADQTQTQQTEQKQEGATEQRSLVNADVKEGEQKKEGAQAAQKTETPPSINVAELKLPEGFKLEDAGAKSFTELLSRQDLSPQARAQELVNLHAAEIKKVTDQIGTQWTQTVEGWHKGIAGDAEIGTGDTKAPLKAEVKTAIAKVLDAYGGTELRQALDLTGAGSNPAIIKALWKMAPKLVETSQHVQGSPPGNKPKGPGASALYPDNPEG